MKPVFEGALCFMFILMASCSQSQQPAGRGKHVVLVGASIGRGWRLEEWQARARASNLSAEAIAEWQFDKSATLGEVLMRPKRKFRPTRTYLKSLFEAPPRRPDAVILKECSAYFPGDAAAYKAKFTAWIAQIENAGIKPMLATVVPVTRARSSQDAGKQESLLAFNDWLRAYAAERRIPVLDLEAALRADDSGRYLRDEFTSGDGSHLNAAAYAVLDQVLLKFLSN